MLLGVILLDLLVVLFGGAVALLPVFARSILHVGPEGLGVLRAAPAVGALAAAVVLTRRPLVRRAGRRLLLVVAVFGGSIIVFGLSRVFALSLVMLAVSGFADMISVNIRTTTVTLATPDRLRGRVSAVEMVFISASNQLGAFESGLAASLVGTVPAVVGGGVITLAIALSWRRLFPSVARIDRLQEISRPASRACSRAGSCRRPSRIPSPAGRASGLSRPGGSRWPSTARAAPASAPCRSRSWAARRRSPPTSASCTRPGAPG